MSVKKKEGNMRIFNKHLILSLSLLIAININALTLDRGVNSVIQNDNEAIGFSVAGDKYWLIQEGYATTDEATCPSSKKMGYYQIVISGCPKPNNAKEIAVNERTGNIAVLTGQLIIKLKTFNNQTLTALENEYNLTINNKFPHLDLVFATTNKVVTASKEVAEHDNVSSVKIDLIKYMLTLN